MGDLSAHSLIFFVSRLSRSPIFFCLSPVRMDSIQDFVFIPRKVAGEIAGTSAPS